MRRTLIFILALLIAALPLAGSFSVSAASKPLVVVWAQGLMKVGRQLKWMMGNITEVEWKVVKGELTPSDLKGAKMLIYVQVDLAVKVSDDELKAIKAWFDGGNKTIWVTGDSDYKGGDFKRIPNANAILKAIGSVLRNDNAEAVDRESNCKKSYRVAALIKPDPELKFLARGVTKPVLFHGPGVVALEVDGTWKPLYGKGAKPVANVYRIAVTSERGAIVEFVAPIPHAYDIGEEGSFTLMAAEIFPKSHNIAILSVEAPFDHYHGMWETVYHGVALDGPTFVKNVILWGVGLLKG